jgi:ADP-ribosyl-[dinitrogen reductase] hydrolase
MIRPRRSQGGLLGVAVGDALGKQAALAAQRRASRDPAEGGLAFGHPDDLPAEWSESTSLTFCTVEALLDDYSLSRLGEFFGRWLQEGYWSASAATPDPTDDATRQAIERITQGVPAEHSGTSDDNCGDCGSLMRILPVALAFSRWSIPVMLERVHEASSVTHAHTRYMMACGLYALVVRNLAYNRSISAAYRNAMNDAKRIYDREPWRSERRPFRRIMRATIGEMSQDQIVFDGSVVSTLEAAVWCLQRTRSFRACMQQVLKFREEIGALAAVAGGLAGVAYGNQEIPDEWISGIARKGDLIQTSKRFAAIVSA